MENHHLKLYQKKNHTGKNNNFKEACTDASKGIGKNICFAVVFRIEALLE